jgi:peptidoglycan/LPS O-acetylase OafA/YrhL
LQSPPDFSRRIPQLDGLRGVAIALVIVFHYVNFAVETGAPQATNVLVRLTSLGWSGVDLFFVLSGFLIGGILLDARGSENYFQVFYLRRVCRIFPLYFAFLGIAFAAAHIWRWQSLFEPKIPWQACVLFCQNFWMAWHRMELRGALNPTWSLAVEEQFYLLIPAVIYLVKPNRLLWIVGSGIVLAPLVRLAIFLENPELTTATYVLLPCRMDALLLGVGAGYFLRQPGAWEKLRKHLRGLWTGIEVLTLVSIVLFIWVSPGDTPRVVNQVIGYDCVDLLYVCILLACLVDERFAGALSARWLRGLGTIAYGVYLLHLLVFGVIVMGLGSYANRGAIALMLALAATVIIAKVSWEWFEKPLVRLGHRIGYRKKVVER